MDILELLGVTAEHAEKMKRDRLVIRVTPGRHEEDYFVRVSPINPKPSSYDFSLERYFEASSNPDEKRELAVKKAREIVDELSPLGLEVRLRPFRTYPADARKA